MHVVRSATLKGYASLVKSLGGDPDRLAAAAGVPPEALHNDELLMPDEDVARAMEVAAEDLRVADFGLRLSDYQDLSGLGPLAVAIRNSATIGEAFENARRFLSLHHQGSTMSLEPDPYADRGIEGLRYVSALSPTAYSQSADNALLNLHRVVELLADGGYGLRSVELGYRPAAELARYEDAFGGVRVNANRPLTMLRLPTALRRRSIEGAQSTLRDVALFYLDRQAVPPNSITTTRAQWVISAEMGSGGSTVASVAAHLGLSTRTLQRRLRDEGISFARLVDASRQQKALDLLRLPTLSMADVAAGLDLTDQATLSRASRRWWGMTPTAKRAILRGSA